MTEAVRLYGPTRGHGSWARIAEGMRNGLSENAALTGFVPTDAYDVEEVYPGHDADVAVHVGDPQRVTVMSSVGWHKERWAMVAPNSSWLPRDLIRWMEQHVTGFLSPSRWGAEVLRRYTALPVAVWQHGVGREFSVDEDTSRRTVTTFQAGDFLVGHLSSSTGERKGTRELLRAWCRAVRDRRFGESSYAHLTVVTDHKDAYEEDFDEFVNGFRGSEVAESVTMPQRLDMKMTTAAHWYRTRHLIAQPSRGEGFGLVPLEAQACGVPVLMTSVTGHSEYYQQRSGTVYVPCGPDAAIDDGPGAEAPSLDEDVVYERLVFAHSRWKDLVAGAQQEAASIRQKWSWEETTFRWLDGRR